ncbi:predicted protein [Postia placenta Mad-698-R]|uniref:F-box domain-containing protein n=1 Tax=Postia placenta MAD-698-R-SB12 TaxID=670580 RepID=A0A1X6MNQ8_9APHY|nr:hypothetical protein POSPLADRAFT_1154970 [Postia placenta MAD-698-R-SB12]EED84051.1 predicted protein [Postia placenta Mad-698-R]OSX58064.1 hypothetical protein POSPLADRAFT_1154970 [Postia placenta MAD-698-R-SB12]
MTPTDELTATVCGALGTLSSARKADLLLETSLSLLEAGRYGEEVESYLEVYLRTPDLPKANVVKALSARANARKAAGERLLARAQQDYNPHDHTGIERTANAPIPIQSPFFNLPASRRAPPEIWEHIATFVPRYHLRTWFFVSPFHRDIAVRRIFRTIDMYFGEDQESVNRGLDIFDRVKADPGFASLVRTLRIHWSSEEGDMFDLMLRLFRTTLPSFKALREFEWIGYPEMRADMVQAVLASHPRLQSVGLIGWHFDAVGVSAFHNLHKFCLRAEDDDGFADMGEVRSVLDQNAGTLRHLTLGAHLQRTHSWDLAFESATLRALTHLDLVDTRISHAVLVRIMHASALRSLTLHGTFADPAAARVVFGSDHVIGGDHAVLPHLEAFRFVTVGHDDDWALFEAVTKFVGQRPRLRRLDLGSCPWELVRGVLPGLAGLRVLRVRIANLCTEAVDALIQAVPKTLLALHLNTVVSNAPLHEYAPAFSVFSTLSMLHLRSHSAHRPQPNLLSEKEFTMQTDHWVTSARAVALALPSLDFVGWHGEHYVVVRAGEKDGGVELKELPSRRRLDCGKGVDLGGEDAAWLERKDVPMDYEMTGLES